MHNPVALADSRNKIDHFQSYLPQCTRSIPQQVILSEQTLSKTPTELRYNERSVFMKEVNNQNQWTFEVGSQENMIVPIWIIIGFQQRDNQDSQSLNFDSFCRLRATSAQCFFWD